MVQLMEILSFSHKLWSTGFAPCLVGSISLLNLAISKCAIAQVPIAPDTTLPMNSRVTSNGNTFIIEDGTKVGSNLFHSFERFSVPTSGTAIFNNALDIQNIISRVTGGSLSTIDGLIQANGTANLFLFNPNGIIFGPNASLNIGGSFLGSTANSLKFADGSEFNATNPQSSLLTVNVPVGLGFGEMPGRIVNQSRATSGSGEVVGLQVQPGKTLGLIGGEVTLPGGYLTAPQGRIELGAVAGNSLVSLTSTATGFALGYQGVRNFQNIQLSQRASVNADGAGGGEIQVQGKQVTLTGGSQILAQTFGSQAGGNVSVNASEAVEVLGTATDGSLDVPATAIGVFLPQPSLISTTTFAAGSGGNLTIQTGRLLVQDGGRIAASTAASGKGGALLIRASESVEVIGKAPLLGVAEIVRQISRALGLSETFLGDVRTASGISTASNDAGDAGNLTIETSKLTVRDGGLITANPVSTGAGGNLTLLASDSVEVSGIASSGVYPSSVTTNSFGAGKAGDLKIVTQNLLIQDGAAVVSSTFASGQAGNIMVEASKSIELTGFSQIVQLSSGLFANSVGTGKAGDVTVTTGQLRIRDRAVISVSGAALGAAGNANIVADSIKLDNQGSIAGATATGMGGNITLNTRDLQLRRQSEITTNASGNAMGGNITLDTNTLVALENSDITANAPQGSGGKISINAQGIFGTQARDRLTPESDITAFGKTAELNGVVNINTPDLSLQNALDTQESTFVNPDEAIANSCLARRNEQQGSFTVTGTGGLPQNPYEALSSRYVVTDVQTLPAESKQQASYPLPTPSSPLPTPWKLGNPIVEAQGMAVTANGRIMVGTTSQLAAAAQPKDLICHISAQPTKQ